MAPASPISPVSPEYSDALPEYMNPHPLLAVEASPGMERDARECSSTNGHLWGDLRANTNGVSQNSGVFPEYVNHQHLLPVDQLSTAPSDSGEFPSADDSAWPYPSRDTGTGENWSIGTASFVFNPSDFFISGDNGPDTVFSDRSEPASYLGRWCQGSSRVLSWVGETVGLFGSVDDEETQSPNKDGEDTDEEGYPERNNAETLDCEIGRNSPRNDEMFNPDIYAEELPLSSSPPDVFEYGSDGEDGLGWGSGSCEDCETFLPRMDGGNFPFVAPGENWPPPDSGAPQIPQQKLQTCPADFRNDAVQMFPDAPIARLRRNRSLSTIFEDPDETPLISITIHCLESIVEPPRQPETESQSYGEAQHLDSSTSSMGQSTDSGNVFSEKIEAESGADTSSTSPSQELSMQRMVGGVCDLDNHANRNPFRRITCQVCCEPEHFEYNPCFRQGTQDSKEPSSPCSSCSMGDIDLYIRSADSEGRMQSPMWVDNCLFEATMMQNPSKKVSCVVMLCMRRCLL